MNVHIITLRDTEWLSFYFVICNTLIICHFFNDHIYFYSNNLCNVKMLIVFNKYCISLLQVQSCYKRNVSNPT